MGSKHSEVDLIEEESKVELEKETMDLSTDLDSLKLVKDEEEEDCDTGDEEEEEEGSDAGDEEEEEGSDAGDAEEEEVKEDSCESDQEWDKDSFEGVVEYVTDEEDDNKEFRAYVRQLYKTECFDVGVGGFSTRGMGIYNGFHAVNLDKHFAPPDLTGRMYMTKMVQVIIAKFNESKGKKLELDHIVKAVVQMAIGVKAYITFMAKECPEGELVEYQGKAEWKVWQKNIHPILCRRASEQRHRD